MNNITLSTAQQRAVDAYEDFLADPSIPYLVISGFAGSGKSFLVQYLADITDSLLDMHSIIDPKFDGYNLYYTTTTHKAAEVLREIVPGQMVTTIHSLLGLRPTKNFNTGQEKLQCVPNAKSKQNLPNSIIILDEASMVGRDLLWHIQSHMKNVKNCRYVFIGDPYQLSPIKENVCPVFKEEVNHVFLDEIQRQMKGSPIIQLSSQYREVLDNPDLGWPEVVGDGQTIFYYDNADDFRDAIGASMGPGHDPLQHKVIAWSNRKVREYNHWIRALGGATNPFEIGDIVMTNKPILTSAKDEANILARTDSLHRIANITDADDQAVPGWYIELTSKSLFTHLNTTIKVFQPADWDQVRVMQNAFAKDKNWKSYFHIKSMWADLRPVHALTCHKAQGSTYGEVFVDMQDIGRNTNWQETARLAYVAITRAKTVLHIYGGVTINHSMKSTNQMKEFDPNALSIIQ